VSERKESQTPPWWERAVIYQIYPRSFQDSNGDGLGDLPGLLSRLDYLANLGVDAVWLSPIYPSPMRDGGYDVVDYLGVDPRFGSLEDLDLLIGEAEQRGVRLMLDLVPSHTSIDHPWFREDPERYIWSDSESLPNNWVGVFGGSAWSRDAQSARWYLHTFFPDQPDLNWRLSRVRDYFADVCRHWVERGVAGFRLDAINCLMKDSLLRDDPPLDGIPPLPHRPEYAELEHRYSQNAPDIGIGLQALRAGAGDDALLVGEIYLPSATLSPYLAHLDAGFSFELLHAEWEARAVRHAIECGLGPDGSGQVAWVLSNHDCERIRNRLGAANIRAAALLQLTLPGIAVIYQGDEIGTGNGPGGSPPDDRVGRDPFRHPMVWDDIAPQGGFTDGSPWLPLIEVPGGGVAQQSADEGSLLSLYRRLISVRRQLRGPLSFVDAADGLLCYQRGSEYLIAINLSKEAQPLALDGTVLCTTHDLGPSGSGSVPRTLAPGRGLVVRTSGPEPERPRRRAHP